MTKMELLAPAGDFERLVFACEYGADAVYLGGNALGLRAKAKNFDDAGLADAVKYAHERGVKVYVTANVFAHDEDFNGMERYFSYLAEIGIDALIISDLGVFGVARAAAPNVSVHVSTQASVTNAKAALMWRELGAKRVILARELSLAEIKRISKETKNGGPELEVFGHGAMCMAYSGRCLMSNYMADRDANRGECAHTCRWKYGSRLHLTEETRPDEVITVADDEDGRGAFVFSSRDLRMVEYLDKLADAGVCAVKIEGRMKTPYYAASTVKAYRMALDDLAKDVKTYRKKIGYYTDETMKSSHRGYCTGFYFGKPDAGGNNYGESGYVQEYMFLGVVREYDAQMKLAVVEQRNRFCAGDKIEVLQKRGMGFEQTVGRIRDMNGADIEVADKVQQYVTIETEKPVSPYDIIRKKT